MVRSIYFHPVPDNLKNKTLNWLKVFIHFFKKIFITIIDFVEADYCTKT